MTKTQRTNTRIAKAMIKKDNKRANVKYQYPFYEDGKQIIVSPFRQLVLGKDFAELENAPDEIDRHCNWKRNAEYTTNTPLEMFYLDELKRYRDYYKKTAKKDKFRFCIGFGTTNKYKKAIAINIDFLIDAMEICGTDCKGYVDDAKFTFIGNDNMFTVMGVILDEPIKAERTDITIPTTD